jgi:hypothetical protein
MPSTFTSNTGIEKPADGEKTGLWGQVVNLNMDIIDRALNGAGTITLSGTTHTLTTSNAVLSAGQFGVLVFSGSPSGTNTVTIAPNTAQKTYWVRNTTSQTVILTQGSGGDVSVPAGATKAVYTTGTGSGATVYDLTGVFTGTVAVSGGTIDGTPIGATTPSTGAFTTATATTFTGALAGNASTATALQTARTIGGVSFDGTANINLPGVNQTGDQNTTGSAATLTTSRTFTIGATGKGFNGSANVAWTLGEIGAQPSGADLTAINALSTNGFPVRTGAGTYAIRSIAGTSPISVANGNGNSGNPTVSITELSQAQAENGASTVMGAASGQRIRQGVLSFVNARLFSETKAVSANTNYTYDVGFIPLIVKLYLVVNSATAGYQVNDNVEVSGTLGNDGSALESGFAAALRGTTVVVRTYNSAKVNALDGSARVFLSWSDVSLRVLAIRFAE